MSIKKIDLKKTRKNGKKICESYLSALEVLRLDLEDSYIFSTSVISVSSDQKTENNIEKLYIEYSEEKLHQFHPASNFLKMCSKISRINSQCGDFLLNKYFYQKTDDIIQNDILSIPKREFLYIKNKSYEYVAHISDEVVYFD